MRRRSLSGWFLPALLTVLLLVAPTGTPRADGGVIPPCTDLSFTGASGQINVRTSPGRYVAWNIAMHDSRRNDGPWLVDVYVNNRRVDHKDQTYQPHGSISPKDLPPNSFVSIEAWHVDMHGTEHNFVPNQCIVP